MLEKQSLLDVSRSIVQSLFSQFFAFSGVSLASRGALIAAVAGGAAGLGGCAQQAPLQRVSAHSKEYFPSSKYGPASPRVVADGEPVPRGGGSYMVGKPYTIAGRTYYPSERRFSAVGLASWYGDAFHGRRTANGEIYNRAALSAAHPTMPLPCYARVTNLRNHRSIIVRVNDRGPFHANRIMDVSRRTAEALEFRHVGTARVKVDYVAPASLEGSDDEKLLATLRIDRPATLEETPSMVAAVETPRQTASLAPVAYAEPVAADERLTDAHPIRRPSGPVARDDDQSPPQATRTFAHAPPPVSRPRELSKARVSVAMRAKSAD